MIMNRSAPRRSVMFTWTRCSLTTKWALQIGLIKSLEMSRHALYRGMQICALRRELQLQQVKIDKKCEGTQQIHAAHKHTHAHDEVHLQLCLTESLQQHTKLDSERRAIEVRRVWQKNRGWNKEERKRGREKKWCYVFLLPLNELQDGPLTYLPPVPSLE